MLANGGQDMCRAGNWAQWVANGPEALVGAARKFKTGQRDTEARGRRSVVRLGCASSLVLERADKRLRILGGLFEHANHHAARVRIGNSP